MPNRSDPIKQSVMYCSECKSVTKHYKRICVPCAKRTNSKLPVSCAAQPVIATNSNIVAGE